MSLNRYKKDQLVSQKKDDQVGFFHVKMYRKKFKKCKWELIGILLTMIAGNLTQYTFMMFGMCIMAVFGVYELSMRRWKFAFLHGFVMLLSVGITVIIWPRVLELSSRKNDGSRCL